MEEIEYYIAKKNDVEEILRPLLKKIDSSIQDVEYAAIMADGKVQSEQVTIFFKYGSSAVVDVTATSLAYIAIDCLQKVA